MKWAIKAWGRDSPDDRKTPHTCKINRKVLFSENGGCTIVSISGRERRRAEERLRACGALSHNEEIREAVEAVSFDDTLGEIGNVVEGGLSEDRVIPVSSIDMYEVIADFERGTRAHQIARVDTKYKIVDRKVKPVAAPLPEGSWNE